MLGGSHMNSWRFSTHQESVTLTSKRAQCHTIPSRSLAIYRE
jgi:hypothetical protein